MAGAAKSLNNNDGRDSAGFGDDSFGIEDESLLLPGGDTPGKPTATKSEPAVEDKAKEEPPKPKPKPSVDEDR